jgi:hypothetical protein
MYLEKNTLMLAYTENVMTKRDTFKQMTISPLRIHVYEKKSQDLIEDLDISRDDIVIKTRKYHAVLIQTVKIDSNFIGWFQEYLEKFAHFTLKELAHHMLFNLYFDFVLDYDDLDYSKGFTLEG